MSKTVILCNPMGTDVTPWVAGTLGSWKLLKGSILDSGDTLYTLPYVNKSGIGNIQNGVPMLDAKIRSTSGTIEVLSYSEGCQVADWWIWENYAGAYASGRLSFISIGNANRNYGGFSYGHPQFDAVGFTRGLPRATLPWPYTDLARQYDGVADFPAAQGIQDALVKIQSSLSNAQNAQAAVAAAASVLSDSSQKEAAMCAMWGMLYVHNWYFNVAPGDAQNTSYTDSTTGVVYELSPTYPVPSLGTGVTVDSKDSALRTKIESCYSRPMSTPTPLTKDYGFGIKGPA